MYAKKHVAQKEVVVGICDKELIGKVLREGELVLNLDRYSPFYVGEVVDEKTACEMLRESTSANLVGKKAVGLAFREKLAEKGCERTVQGVPHIQIYKLDV